MYGYVDIRLCISILLCTSRQALSLCRACSPMRRRQRRRAIAIAIQRLKRVPGGRLARAHQVAPVAAARQRLHKTRVARVRSIGKVAQKRTRVRTRVRSMPVVNATAQPRHQTRLTTHRTRRRRGTSTGARSGGARGSTSQHASSNRLVCRHGEQRRTEQTCGRLRKRLGDLPSPKGCRRNRSPRNTWNRIQHRDG